MRIYLLRHGRTRDNAEGRYQGVRDTALSPEGEAELMQADIAPARVFVSPLRRARRTAQLLFPAAVQQVVDDLREMDFGEFEGRSAAEMTGDAAYRAWVEGNCTAPCPGGESREGFSNRVCAAFSALVESTLAAEEEELVIVAHGGVQMAVMERFSLLKRDFYAYCGPLGGGYLLEPLLWQRDRALRLIETLRYTRGGEPC